MHRNRQVRDLFRSAHPYVEFGQKPLSLRNKRNGSSSPPFLPGAASPRFEGKYRDGVHTADVSDLMRGLAGAAFVKRMIFELQDQLLPL